MTKVKSVLGLCVLIMFVLSSLASSVDSFAASGAPSKEIVPETRAFRAGLTFQSLTQKSFQNVKNLGFGGVAVYEFFISPSSSIGFQVALRRYGGSGGLSQFGYGALMKHLLMQDFLWSLFRPYFEYGLLVQQSRLNGASGAGTSHDTRLALGVEIGRSFFFDLGYHVSSLGFLNTVSTDLNYFEMTMGARVAF